MEALRSSPRLQKKPSSTVKTEQPELDHIKMAAKSPAIKRKSARLTPKIEDPYTSMQTKVPNQKRTPWEDADGALGLWRGNAVGRNAKDVFEIIEHCYPTTFQRVQIRATPFWLGNLKELHVLITRFMGSSVEELAEGEISGLRRDFRDLEILGFNLSWAHTRLDMVSRIKFGKEVLQKEWVELDKSLVVMKERVDEMMKEMIRAKDMYEKAVGEYEDAKKARNKKSEEMVQVFGADFDQVLKNRLGFGMLPGYMYLI